MVNVSGTLSYCTNPVPGPVPNVTLTVTGTSGASATTDSSGNYTLSLTAGGNYTLTPSKARRPLASSGINTIDAVALQRHFLHLGTPLSGCQLSAADTTGDGLYNTSDVVAIQRFLLGAATGTANTGKYVFNPAIRTYSAVVTDQTSQNFDTIVLGDIVAGFVERPEGPLQNVMEDETAAIEAAPAVAKVSLPNVVVDANTTNFAAEVMASSITPQANLIGFQADISFDSTAINFETEPIQQAGLTNGNWNVTGRVLDGTGPIRTLRVSAFSNDFTPLSGGGTLFELLIVRTGKADQITQLFWAQPPDHLIFIDADLKTHKPGYTAAGSITASWAQRITPASSTVPEESPAAESEAEIVESEDGIN